VEATERTSGGGRRDPHDDVAKVAVSERTRVALAGAAAACIWAAAEALDRRLFRYDYSDVALLGKWVTRSRWWPLAGLALHAANGATFGLAFHEVRRRTEIAPRPLAVALGLAEHVALYPLSYFVDTRHPARGEPGVPRLLTGRAFAQATVRHAVFGVVLGRLAASEPLTRGRTGRRGALVGARRRPRSRR
jgi:hypothetical protein